MAELTYTADYQTAFDTKTYLALCKKIFNVENDEEGSAEFRMKHIHTFWSNIKLSSQADASGIRCLEYGGGPSIINLISASPKVDHIVFAEYLETNREAVKSWIAGCPDAYDWSPYIRYVVRDLEGDSTQEAIENRERDLKQKIKSVVACDVTKHSIVDLESSDIGKPFDVISTSLCVEVNASSEEHYKSTMAKLCKLLKPNGYLVMFGVVGESYYCVGESAKFCHFPVSRGMIEEAMKEAGVEEIKIELLGVERSKSDVSDSHAFFFGSAKMPDKGTEL